VGTSLALKRIVGFSLLENSAMTLTCDRVGHLVLRIQNDFLTDRRLTLSLGEARRRFRLDGPTCTAILDLLVDAGVLTRTSAGAYIRNFPQRATRAAA
jgi:hypothetical protein